MKENCKRTLPQIIQDGTFLQQFAPKIKESHYLFQCFSLHPIVSMLNIFAGKLLPLVLQLLQDIQAMFLWEPGLLEGALSQGWRWQGGHFGSWGCEQLGAVSHVLQVVCLRWGPSSSSVRVTALRWFCCHIPGFPGHLSVSSAHAPSVSPSISHTPFLCPNCRSRLQHLLLWGPMTYQRAAVCFLCCVTGSGE